MKCLEQPSENWILRSVRTNIYLLPALYSITQLVYPTLVCSLGKSLQAMKLFNAQESIEVTSKTGVLV